MAPNAWRLAVFLHAVHGCTEIVPLSSGVFGYGPVYDYVAPPTISWTFDLSALDPQALVMDVRKVSGYFDKPTDHLDIYIDGEFVQSCSIYGSPQDGCTADEGYTCEGALDVSSYSMYTSSLTVNLTYVSDSSPTAYYCGEWLRGYFVSRLVPLHQRNYIFSNLRQIFSGRRLTLKSSLALPPARQRLNREQPPHRCSRCPASVSLSLYLPLAPFLPFCSLSFPLWV